MILDAYNIFEPIGGTAIAASGPSTNTIDMLNPRDMGIGEEELNIIAYCTATFNNLTSLRIDVQTSTDNATWTTIQSGPAVLLANLTAGTKLMDQKIGHRYVGGAMPRYYRLFYTIVGTAPTTGALNASIAIDTQAAPAYPAGIVIYN